MTDQHTPGPWTLDDSYDPTGSLQGWAYVIAEEEAMYDAANASDEDAVMDAANETHAANARLIAAAPLMLDALRALTATARTFRNVPAEDQEWTPLDDEALDAAFAAIDVATGSTLVTPQTSADCERCARVSPLRCPEHATGRPLAEAASEHAARPVSGTHIDTIA